MRKLFHIDLLERMERNGFMHWIDCYISIGDSDRCCTYLPYAD